MNVAAFLKSRSSEFLKEHEDGVSVRDLCRKHGVSDASITIGRAASAEWMSPRLGD